MIEIDGIDETSAETIVVDGITAAIGIVDGRARHVVIIGTSDETTTAVDSKRRRRIVRPIAHSSSAPLTRQSRPRTFCHISRPTET